MHDACAHASSACIHIGEKTTLCTRACKKKDAFASFQAVAKGVRPFAARVHIRNTCRMKRRKTAFSLLLVRRKLSMFSETLRFRFVTGVPSRTFRASPSSVAYSPLRCASLHRMFARFSRVPCTAPSRRTRILPPFLAAWQRVKRLFDTQKEPQNCGSFYNAFRPKKG